jgi:hypothetical protein
MLFYISVIYQIPLKKATKIRSFLTESIFSDNYAQSKNVFCQNRSW